MAGNTTHNEMDNQQAKLGINPGFNLSSHSVASYDFLPSPHNKVASLHGPPVWHEDYREQHPAPEPKLEDPGQIGQPENSQEGRGFGSSPLLSTSAAAHFSPLPVHSNLTFSPESYTAQVGYPTASPYNQHVPMWNPFVPTYAQALAADQLEGQKKIPEPKDTGMRLQAAPYPVFVHPFPYLNPQANAFTPSKPTRCASPVMQKPPSLPVDEIVSRLLRWPRSNTNYAGFVTVELPLVIKCIGPSPDIHMQFHPDLHRACLREDSELRHRGREFGIPEKYMQWLIGEDSSNFVSLHVNDLIVGEWEGRKAVQAMKTGKVAQGRGARRRRH